MKEVLFDMQRVAVIEARLAATTAGPWKSMIEGRDHSSGSSCIATASGAIELGGATDSDIEFISNARQDMPYLIAELRRLALMVDTQKK